MNAPKNSQLLASGPIPPEIARSWLLVNGLRHESFESASASGADQIVLDVEDAVDPAFKGEALDHVSRWLEGRSAWIRINDRLSDYWALDVDRLKGLPGLLGVMLAKTESAEHVTETFDRLGGTRPVLALVESAMGIEHCVDIAQARGTFRLAFGSGDYRRDTGTDAGDLAMVYPRSRLVVASRVGNLPGPIDGPTVSSSHPVLRTQSEVTVALGLTGKLCLNTNQVAVINETISPAPSDVHWARGFLMEFEARGKVIVDGSDLPRLGRAEKIMRLAVAFSVNLD